MEYLVKIDAFEGPLDLLLHLIQKLEIDIYDIPMKEITEQYMSYIHTMQELHLDVASEYLVMAATLLAIKSKMLLPKQDPEMLIDDEYQYEEDPREELVERLIEYKKYKEVAKELKDREEERSLMFTRPPIDLSQYEKTEIPANIDLNVSVYDMIAAFQKLLRRKRLQRPLSTRITRQDISIEQRMDDIRALLHPYFKKPFFELFQYQDKSQLVVTFLALLELLKRNEITVQQQDNFSELFILAV
ncbi:condensin subunit ScpA [Bacillus oleivorans]|uniref:Segregation and condensation protein A n=1 Tax=Bacillus oleivorans TaxID=1448271 RepID=A0A285CKL3_9BACI|nr:segregation/condensation protein A [Bacillus oleivorans]SNX68089.1 condensin subunit ScpA [Bacillus oleivorans]